jgi:hypothetical protein
MKPYYEHAGITIYHGDCREILPACESIITDPVWPNCPPGLLAGGEDPWRLFEQFCKSQRWGQRATFVMRCDSDPSMLVPVQLPFARISILPYVMPGYIGRWLGGDELAYSYGAAPLNAGRRKS